MNTQGTKTDHRTENFNGLKNFGNFATIGLKRLGLKLPIKKECLFTLLYSISLDKNLASPRILFAVAQSGLESNGKTNYFYSKVLSINKDERLKVLCIILNMISNKITPSS